MTFAVMDHEPEDLQFLGFFGVCREAYKLVLSWRRLFAHIVLTLISPLALIFLAHIYISHLLFSKIHRNASALDDAPSGSASESRLLSRLFSEWAGVLLFKAAYLVGVLVFSLLSTSAVVYTVASVYTAKELSFKKVLFVVPKVWRRLMVTFLWAFLILVGYNVAAGVVIVLVLLAFGPSAEAIVVISVLGIAYTVGLVLVSVVWHLASVVSVLEDSWGIGAMRKSRELLRGKMVMVVSMFSVLNMAFAGVELGFRVLVADGRVVQGAVGRAGCAAAMLAAMAGLILIGLVVQTVIYFVCKAYHHESIDKSSLADHLELYLGEYVPLKGKDVQLEQYYV